MNFTLVAPNIRSSGTIQLSRIILYLHKNPELDSYPKSYSRAVAGNGDSTAKTIPSIIFSFDGGGEG